MLNLAVVHYVSAFSGELFASLFQGFSRMFEKLWMEINTVLNILKREFYILLETYCLNLMLVRFHFCT